MTPSYEGMRLPDRYILAFLCALSTLLIGYRLSQPEMPYFDEVYFVPSAREILAGAGLGEVTHPPLGKLLIAGSIWLFGDAPFAWRLPSLLSGVALVGLVFQLLRQFGASLVSASFAGLFVVLDGLCLTQARIGLVNAPCVALGFGALLCASRGKPLGAGVLLGLSCACKFVGFAFAPLVFALLTIINSPSRCDIVKPVWRLVVVMLIAALVSYLLAFAHVQSSGGSFWKGVLFYHRTILDHHFTQASVSHRYESSWWTWPLSLRPIWYGFEAISGTSSIRGVICMANPITSVGVLLGIGVALMRMVMRRTLSYGEWIAISGFSVQLFPWALSPRVTMYHYYYPALVFGVVLLCLQLDRLKPRARVSVFTIFGLALAAMFLYWYPLWTALPISRSSYESMIWFQGWI